MTACKKLLKKNCHCLERCKGGNLQEKWLVSFNLLRKHFIVQQFVILLHKLDPCSPALSCFNMWLMSYVLRCSGLFKDCDVYLISITSFTSRGLSNLCFHTFFVLCCFSSSDSAQSLQIENVEVVMGYTYLPHRKKHRIKTYVVHLQCTVKFHPHNSWLKWLYWLIDK